MSVGVQGTHDIKLESSDDASPTTTVELMLAVDKETLAPRWRELRLPPFPPRQSQGEVNYAHHDPTTDLVFSQKDWSGGGLQTVFSSTEPNRYARANGADLRWPNTATLGMKLENRIQFLVPNGGAEINSTTVWTVPAGHTLTNVTTNPRTTTDSKSARHWSLATTGTSVSSYIAITNPTVYQSRTVSFTCYILKNSGDSNGLRLQLTDDAGSTNGTTVTAGSYTIATVTRTIDAAATFVRVRFTDVASTATYFIDDIAGFSSDANGGMVCYGVAEDNEVLYGIFGRFVCQWDETNDVWNAVYIHALSYATSIVSYNENIYVAFGSGGDVEYIYGTTTSWTVSNLAGDAKFAYFFTVSRQTLWKSRADGAALLHVYLASSTNPVNGGSWSSEYTVGSSDRAITSLTSFNDSLLVGKQDGLYLYLRTYDDGTSADLFLNVTNEFVNMVHADNFYRMKEWHGWVYMVASQQSFFRYNGTEYQEISSLLHAPRLTGDFGGRVRAITADPAQLWLLVDSATANTTNTKQTWLMSFREVGGRFQLHPIAKLAVGDINWIEVNRGYLWIFGRLYNTDNANQYDSAIYRFVLPTQTIAPAYDATPSIETSGNFDTSIWDGELPDEQKAFISLTLFVKPSTMDAEHTIVAKFGLDGASSTTTTLATFSGSGAIQTKYFDTITAPETNAVGRSIQLNFAFATDDNVSPELYAFALHSVLRPNRVKVYEAYVYIGDGVIQHNGMIDPESKLTKLNNLLTLENQIYPIRLTADLNASRDTAVASMALGQKAVHIIPGSLERVPTEERDNGLEVWKLLLQEVTVS
ncbi:MAG: hypothetical protein HY459_02810 [Parcubacteria group bacterium]|nr:hypothetical protein [Parcubacteria group bacterium]